MLKKLYDWVTKNEGLDNPANPMFKPSAVDTKYKWNITAKEAIVKFGSAIEALKEFSIDGTPHEVHQLNIYAILELEERLHQLERRFDKIDPLGITK